MKGSACEGYVTPSKGYLLGSRTFRPDSSEILRSTSRSGFFVMSCVVQVGSTRQRSWKRFLPRPRNEGSYNYGCRTLVNATADAYVRTFCLNKCMCVPAILGITISEVGSKFREASQLPDLPSTAAILRSRIRCSFRCRLRW